MKIFRVKQDESGISAGTILYALIGWDYGCANDDTRIFGNGYDEYTSVTHNSNGEYPSFTMRKQNLEIIGEK